MRMIMRAPLVIAACLAMVSVARADSTLTAPGAIALVPLDAATVATGGTAVVASTIGHHNKGGFIYNPSTATQPLCIDEIDTAGAASAGNTTCIVPGQTYLLAPNPFYAVTVVSSDSAHAFSGAGWN